MPQIAIIQDGHPGLMFNAFSVYIESASELYKGHVTLYSTAGNVDFDCKKLSKLFPAIRVCIMWRNVIRATYMNGERTLLSPAQDVYSTLSDKEIADSKFKDSDSSEMI